MRESMQVTGRSWLAGESCYGWLVGLGSWNSLAPTDEIPLRWREREVAMVEIAGVGGVLCFDVLDVRGGHDETIFD